MIKSFFWSQLGRIYIAGALLTLLLLIFLVNDKWEELVNEQHIELAGVHQMIKRSAHDRFVQQEAMLKLLGQRLIEAGGLEETESISQIMDGLLRDNPVFAAYGLVSPNGQIIFSSQNLQGKELPNLLDLPESSRSFRKTLESNDLTIGETYFFKPLGIWMVPLRYAVRNEANEVVMVISTAFDIDGIFNPWSTRDIKEEIGLNITSESDHKGNYYPIFYDPYEIIAPSKNEAYGKPLPEKFVKTADKRSKEASGLGLKELQESDVVVSLINDTKGLVPAYVLLSFDRKFRYYIAIRQPMSFIKSEYHSYSATSAIVFLLFNSFAFFIFYRFYQSENEYKAGLKYQALHDQLTDLPNRYYLGQEHAAWTKKKNGSYALLYLDLDNFKFVNDHFAHSVGDQVLKEISSRLQHKCDDRMILVRQGGDEFIILVPFNDQQQLEVFAQQVLYRINEVMFINGIKIAISASMGIARAKAESTKLDDLLAYADLAMYEAKKLRNHYSFFSSHLQQKTAERAIIEGELRTALDQNEMYMIYQPQIDAISGDVIGIEALIRWHNPKLGAVRPDVFIPISEACGQINIIGDFVIDSVLSEVSQMSDILGELTVSINVSVHQLIYGGVRDTLKTKMLEYDIDPSRIIIEITVTSTGRCNTLLISKEGVLRNVEKTIP
jgi:diguanylate cyclase (GGDEF)-like protein